jgi:hypothetical protein
MSWAAWVSSSDRALTMAASQIRLIRAVTPSNADSELADLERSFRRGAPRLPRWRYDASTLPPDLPRALEELASFLDKEPPLGPLYAARARELCLEAVIVDAAGTARLTAAARERFLGSSPQGDVDGRQADDLALTWTSGASADGAESSARAAKEREEFVRSCDATDPRSLLSRLATEVGRKRLPMQVCVQAGMASLAATGDGVILVAKNKWLPRRDVERTVLHEIEGHALPRARASRAPLGLFAFGTARGVDDQEGRAIVIEEKAGFLDAARKFELGCRHLAARAALEGADFPEIVGVLQARGAVIESALRIAARVQRGSHGVGGLAREVVYLRARCKVERLLRGPGGRKIEQVMRCGRIAADVALEVATLSNEHPGQRGERGEHFALAEQAKCAVSSGSR